MAPAAAEAAKDAFDAAGLGPDDIDIAEIYDSYPVFNLIGRALRNGSRRIIIADPGRPTFYELCDLCANRYNVTLTEWYAVEPNRCSGEILEIRP